MRSKNQRALAKRISQKNISGTVKPVSGKKLQNGTLLVEVSKKKMNLFAGLKIKAYPHISLNISNGVVHCAQLRAFPRGKNANSPKRSIFCQIRGKNANSQKCSIFCKIRGKNTNTGQ